MAPELIRDFRSGKWGMVTNGSTIRTIRQVGCLDQLEGRIASVRAFGKYRSTVELRFDWLISEGERRGELVASGEMTTTWVEMSVRA